MGHGLEQGAIVGANIRRAAEAKGMSLNALADFASVSRSQLYDVLAAKKSPTVDWLVKIAEVLEVEAWTLLKPPTLAE